MEKVGGEERVETLKPKETRSDQSEQYKQGGPDVYPESHTLAIYYLLMFSINS